jgi:hypothetical protein
VAWNAQEVGMPAQGERPEALENHFGSAGGAVEQQKGVVARQKPIKVVLPHAEMELHPMGNVLSREEYYKLTRAVGLVEASSVMSHHGLGVGEVPPDDLAAVGGRVGEGSGSNVRFADQTSTADPTQFAQELAA